MMHGPFNGVGPATGIILVADQIGQSQRLSAFFKGVKLIGTAFASVAASQTVTDSVGPFDIVLPACDDEAVRAILGVVPFQLLARRSRRCTRCADRYGAVSGALFGSRIKQHPQMSGRALINQVEGNK